MSGGITSPAYGGKDHHSGSLGCLRAARAPCFPSEADKSGVALRVPADVLERWKATGPGWQTRMAEVLAKAL